MDVISILKENGQSEDMEVVTIFDMNNSQYHYVIYKSLQGEYFVGKFLGEDVVDLVTDLSSMELEYAKGILGGLVGV